MWGLHLISSLSSGKYVQNKNKSRRAIYHTPVKIKIHRNGLLKILLEEFRSKETLIICISLQIAYVPLLVHACFLQQSLERRAMHMHDPAQCYMGCFLHTFSASCQPHWLDELGEGSVGDFSQFLKVCSLVNTEEVEVLCHNDFSQDLMTLSWILKNCLHFLCSRRPTVFGWVFVRQLESIFYYHYL